MMNINQNYTQTHKRRNPVYLLQDVCRNTFSKYNLGKITIKNANKRDDKY